MGRAWARPARAVFAAAFVWLGILGLMHGDFAPGWQPVPKWLPARTAVAYLCALVCLGCGAGLLWRRTAAAAARLLWAWLLLWLVLLRAPWIALSPTVGIWWPACSTAMLTAAAWILYVELGGRGLRAARVLFGVALIPIGLAHFLYLGATAPLVPRWLPWHVGWAYFTGGTFIAAGVAIIAGVLAPLAAALAALQLGLFTLLVWAPVVAAGANAGQWSEFVVSAVLTAAAWVVAESYRPAISTEGQQG